MSKLKPYSFEIINGIYYWVEITVANIKVSPGFYPTGKKTDFSGFDKLFYTIFAK